MTLQRLPTPQQNDKQSASSAPTTFEVILFEPQIPSNTGNIVRTCAVTGSSLVLAGTLGFSISNRALKRAGLDYWEGVAVSRCADLVGYLEQADFPFYFFSSHAKRPYTEIPFCKGDRLIFGSETSGLSPAFREKWPERFYTIPMKEGARCLNLANAVSIVLYEGWRQQQFL